MIALCETCFRPTSVIESANIRSVKGDDLLPIQGR